MTDTVLTVGIPTLAALVGILVSAVIGLAGAHVLNRCPNCGHVNQRFSSLEKLMDARFEAAHQELLRVEGALDAR